MIHSGPTLATSEEEESGSEAKCPRRPIVLNLELSEVHQFATFYEQELKFRTPLFEGDKSYETDLINEFQMRAIAVVPSRPETAGVIDLPEPPESDGSVLVRTRSIGLCGTDLEIALHGYGVPPSGEERLVLGHESIGEVIEAPEGSGFELGNLVVGVVRKPDPIPCHACAVDEWDMCRHGHYNRSHLNQ